MKFFAILPAAAIFAAPAVAGPYANIEANSKFSGSDYSKTVIDNHVGYEGKITDTAKYYVQGGPALVLKDGEPLTTELSGKAGVKVKLSEQVGIYKEIKFLTGAQSDYGIKAGVKYTF